MRAKPAGAGTDQHSCDGRKLHQIDDGERAVIGVANVRAQMKAGAQERRPQLHGNLANRDDPQNQNDDQNSPISANLHGVTRGSIDCA